MRASTASFLTVLLGASQVLATCVEGHREEISPDYIVEYKCNYYRAGNIHKNIDSATECAKLAKDQGAIASTYHITKK
ncbi:hypothetical protein FANTH_6910 [Fusarium anthophilum]|uniref:Uncharacterized protein n=1 Tax=Fusarium anthophilum TaxID=48485 RepID=A0A8H5E3W7_9HYPO|nr:hypothetical protein FANTH_6910 [Fusarium anthophilum]